MKNLFSGNRSLYLITDRAIAALTLTEIAREAITAGIRVIQLREKNISKKKLFREASSLIKLFSKYRVLFIINDYVDIALALSACGVHLGQDDMPLREARKIMGRWKIIGISTHTLKQALEAQEGGASYIAFGPIFHTTTKDAGEPKGIDALKEIKKHIKIPVVAIGGITAENAYQVLEAGADAIAVASGILSGDIKTNTERFFKTIKELRRREGVS